MLFFFNLFWKLQCAVRPEVLLVLIFATRALWIVQKFLWPFVLQKPEKNIVWHIFREERNAKEQIPFDTWSRPSVLSSISSTEHVVCIYIPLTTDVRTTQFFSFNPQNPAFSGLCGPPIQVPLFCSATLPRKNQDHPIRVLHKLH